MGNVSDNNLATSSSTRDSSSGVSSSRLGSSPSAGDQSSSLEWFDASESIASSPTVRVAVKVVNVSKGEVDAFLERAGKALGGSNSPLETPTTFPDIESRSPTSRFLGSKGSPKRALLARLTPYEQHLFLKTSPLSLPPLPKKEKEGQKEQMEASEDMKRGEAKNEKEDEEHRVETNIDEKKDEEETNVKENNVETNEEVLKENPLEEELAGDENKEKTEGEGIFEENNNRSPSPIPPNPHSSNTPDVLSDIPFDILLDSPLPSPTSSSTPPTTIEDLTDTPSNLTDADMKRQKKKERKKSRRINKEHQMKRQLHQQAEAIKNREEKLERERQRLAEAAVVKPTVVSTAPMQQEQQLEEQKKEANEEVSVVKIEVNLKENDTTSTLTSSSFTSPSPPSSSSSPDFPFTSSSSSFIPQGDSRPISVEKTDSTCSLKTYQEIPIVVGGQNMVIHLPKDQDISSSIDQNMELVLDSKEVVESLDTFEVLVCGERRKVTPFVPRSKQNSISNSGEDSQVSVESSSSNSVYDIPEHPPVVVPFSEAPIITTSSSQQLPQMRPPPPFLTMPMTYNSQHPIIVGPPIISSYGPVQSRFLPMQSSFPQQPFPPPAVVPVSMQRIPMQRISQVPVMMNRPIFIPPAHQGSPGLQMQPMMPPPPPQPQIVQQPVSQRPPMQAIPVPPPSHMVIHQVFPGQRPLVRPTRTPLAITAPPAPLAISKPKPDKAEKSDTKKKSDSEKPNKVKKFVEKMERERGSSSSSHSSAVAEQSVVIEQTIVAEQHDAVEQETSTNSQVDIVQTEVIERSEDIVETEQSRPLEFRRSSSFELNGELITAGVASVLDESDEELPSISSTSTSFGANGSQSQVIPEEAFTRLSELPKQHVVPGFEVWAGWMNDMPVFPKPPPGLDISFRKFFEDDERTAMMEKEEEFEFKTIERSTNEEGDEKPTLMFICKEIEQYFKSSGARGKSVTIDSEQLRQMFIEAYDGKIPREHWSILEKVCSFQPGYFHVFDVLIGSLMEFTYKFLSTPEFKQDKTVDSLYNFYQSLPPVDGVENFFKRFEETILPDLIKFLSNRFVSVRSFVAIAEVVKENELTRSDLYYLAALVFGARQFFSKFNNKIKQLHIIETGGKRWVRQTMMDELRTKPSFPTTSESRMSSVSDFLTRLRPHIDDILQLLPDAVVNDDEFFKAAKLVCGWTGEEEERVWKLIIRDRIKFKEFHEAYRPFLRIEIRMGAVYLRKLTYDDDYDNENEGKPVDVVISSGGTNLISSIKSDECRKEKKKEVSYATEVELITPDAPPEPSGSNRSTQTDNMNIDRMWDLEREVIRMLKRDNISFAEFIQSENAREMYQFLIDAFKANNLRYFAFILEKTLIETRQEAWNETNSLRRAAEEARELLEVSREEHKKEFGDLRSRMEIISRFEAYEVQVASNSRIDGLKERIQQLTEEREIMLREEVKEERARLQRQLKEMKEKHAEEKRLYQNEIVRLREENARLAAGRQESSLVQDKRAELTADCGSRMNKTKTKSENSSILINGHRESEILRERNEPSLMASLDNESVINTPESQPESVFLPEEEDEEPCTSSSIPVQSRSSVQVKLSSEALRQLKIMEKYASEFNADELRAFARDLLECYNATKANHKERKTAEKQLKEYEAVLEIIENAIQENLEMVKLNVVEGLLEIPGVPSPFSETVLKKMFDYSGSEREIIQTNEELSEEEEDGCLICTEIVEESCETVTCDTCTKEYHYHCISQWLRINSVCPACARALKDPNEYPMLE